MAQILSFRTPEYRSSDAGARRAGISAEVILFPGVRYERWGDVDTSTASRDHDASRDVLELAE
jgi:hypothetical protein